MQEAPCTCVEAHDTGLASKKMSKLFYIATIQIMALGYCVSCQCCRNGRRCLSLWDRMSCIEAPCQNGIAQRMCTCKVGVMIVHAAT